MHFDISIVKSYQKIGIFAMKTRYFKASMENASNGFQVNFNAQKGLILLEIETAIRIQI